MNTDLISTLSTPLQNTASAQSDQTVFSEVSYIERKGDALHPTPLASDQSVLGLNLMRGCAYRCSFCSVRAHSGATSNHQVAVYTRTVPDVIREVEEKQPRAVLICPGTDPFPPMPEVQEESACVVEALSELGVESWLMTRGLIQPSVLQVLAQHKEHVRVTVGIATLDEQIHRMLEPGTATPSVRLEQIARLQAAGLRVQVALEPLIPNLTDKRHCIEEILEALEMLGVSEITTGYMFLRTGIEANLREALKEHGSADIVLDAYRGGPMLTGNGLAAARYLPKGRRQRGYAMIKAMAARHGITVLVNRVTNSDFSAKKNSEDTPRPRLLSLFLENRDRA